MDKVVQMGVWKYRLYNTLIMVLAGIIIFLAGAGTIHLKASNQGLYEKKDRLEVQIQSLHQEQERLEAELSKK